MGGSDLRRAKTRHEAAPPAGCRRLGLAALSIRAYDIGTLK
jgi:hypothetical protein